MSSETIPCEKCGWIAGTHPCDPKGASARSPSCVHGLEFVACYECRLRKIQVVNARLWEVADAAREFRSEMENPCPDPLFRQVLRRKLFDALDALEGRE